MKVRESKSKDVVEEKEVREALAIEAANIGIFEWDIATSAFTASARFSEIFNLDPEIPFTQSDLAAMVYGEDEPVRLKAHEQAAKTGKLFYEARFILPNKDIRWVRVTGKVITDQHGQATKMFGAAVDITDERTASQRLEQLVRERTFSLQKKIEELKISEARYHRMVEEVTDYSIILLDPQGIIQNWNKGAENIKGYTESEAVGQSFRIFYLPEDQKNNLPDSLLNEARRAGRAVHEGWRVRKDRTTFWGSTTITALHNDQNEVVGFSKVTRDLTHSKISQDQQKAATAELARRNEELRKSEERYHKMISEVQDYAIILLDSKGCIQNWNAGAESIKGYTAKEIIGKSFEIFYTESDRESGLPFKLLNKALTAGKASHEGWRVRKNGTKFWGSIVLTALHGDDGHVIGFSKVTRDLTERKMAEDKLVQTNAELEAQNKELEQFAYVASHDLQEPLRKIQTFADIIRRNKDDTAIDKYFEKIQFAANRMSELIKAVLNYSRLSKDAEEKVSVDLNVVLGHVKSDFELLIQEKHAAIASDPLPSVKAYPLQIGQLFYNLVGNALKFSSEHPVVRITWRTVSWNQIQDKPESLHANRYYEFQFEDNGIGFEQEYKERIFMMFQRLHGRHQYAGTGIGLALCKKIVDLHEGHITATSEVGKGSTFFVYLPVL
ncbi:MAG TPA: PAS domain S-box protein [Cyclobacteriaceae bacterium]|nr:PAS domain S-box protein [Cyclobacteriaceae bacterium]